MILSQIISKIKNKGHRLTSVRKAIIEILFKSKIPISAQEILVKLRKINLNPNKTTIYREINFLISDKIIKEVEFGDGKKRYEINSNNHHHHLVCLKCHKVEDIPSQGDLSHYEKEIKKRKYFNISYHLLEFFGFCKKCQYLNT